VTVRAPYRTSIRKIENLVIAKTPWIIKHLANYKSATRINNNRYYSDESHLLFRGKDYPIRFIESKRNFIMFDENQLEIGLKDNKEREKAGTMIDKWYREVAEELFRNKFEEILNRFILISLLPNSQSGH
jgi:predicted metal-dependent hydrolase